MAKALLGYMSSDLHTTQRLTAENRRLRERVVELETVVLRLSAENDALTTAHAAALLDLDAAPEMQPA